MPAVPRRPARSAGLVLVAGLAAAIVIAPFVTRPAGDPRPVTGVPAPLVVPDPAPPPPAAMPAPVPAPAPVTVPRGSLPGLSVNATFATRDGGGTILATRADGTRALVAAGADVVPGTRLVAVAATRAIFAAGGARFWMPVQSVAAAAADPGPAAPAPPPVAATPPADAPSAAEELRESQAYQAALAPGADGVHRGYAVRALPPLFARAGLRPGDIITGINGRAFGGPAEIALLAREARLSTTLVFTIRRGGATQDVQVQPR